MDPQAVRTDLRSRKDRAHAPAGCAHSLTSRKGPSRSLPKKVCRSERLLVHTGAVRTDGHLRQTASASAVLTGVLGGRKLWDAAPTGGAGRGLQSGAPNPAALGLGGVSSWVGRGGADSGRSPSGRGAGTSGLGRTSKPCSRKAFRWQASRRPNRQTEGGGRADVWRHRPPPPARSSEEAGQLPSRWRRARTGWKLYTMALGQRYIPQPTGAVFCPVAAPSPPSSGDPAKSGRAARR